MSEILKKLQEVANAALSSKTPEESMKHLAKGFSLFTREAKRLEVSYLTVQNRLNIVNKQLKKTENSLTEKITDLNSVTSYLNNILKNISQGILFIDLDGIVTTYNSAAEKILKKEEKKVLFNNFWDNFADDFFGFSMKGAISFKLDHNVNFISLKKERKEIEVTTSFVYDCPKAYQGIIVLLRDVTKIQKLQHLANRNDRLKELGLMAAGVAHEIKNPLGAIRGYASLLYRDLEDNKQLCDMASYIIDGTKSLERIVNNVLLYTRPLKLDPISLNIVKLIEDLIGSIKVDTNYSKNIKIDFHKSSKSIDVFVDRELLKAAILNIILNAYQAMDGIGVLSISIYQNNLGCMIVVADTGEGIDEKDIENIFSPFFTTKQRGNGLGLSEAYKIIQAHFGSIDVRSVMNKGSTFSIYLPIKR